MTSLPMWLYVMLVAVVVQILKFTLYGLVRRRWNLRLLVASNGMPSLHAVVLSCLATLIASARGIADPAYNAVVLYGAIVLHDAMKVKGRVEAGHGTALVVADLLERHRPGAPLWREILLPVSSRRSHRPSYVAAGVVLGVAAALARPWLP